MKTYTITITGDTEMTVQADSEEQAIDIASDYCSGLISEDDKAITDDGHANILSNWEITNTQEATA